MRKMVLNALRSLDTTIYDNYGPIRVLFVIRNLLGVSCLLPLIREAEKRNIISIAITEESEGCYKWPTTGEIYELYSSYFVKTTLCTYKKWHYVFTTDVTNLYFKRDTTQVYTQHGGAYGNLDKRSKSCNYGENLVLHSGSSIFFYNSRGNYSEYHKYALDDNSKKSFISGFPKIDWLANSSKKIGEDFLIELGLDIKKQTVVLASHWNPKSVFNSLRSDIVENLCSNTSNLNFIATGHGNLWRDNDFLYQEFFKKEEVYKNYRFLPNLLDTVPLLKCADLFIGDNSSIFIEFCLMDKPILFFDHPEFEFKNSTVGSLYKNASTCFSTINNLYEVVNAEIINLDQHKLARKKVVEHFLSRVGQSSKYTIDIIERLGRVSGPKSKNWNRVIDLSNSEMLDFNCQQ